MQVNNHLYGDRRAWFLTQRANSYKQQKVDIVQIGDSITEGFNLSRYLITNKVIVNSGVGGDVTDLLLKRYQRDCLDYNPELVIMMIGINDIRTFFKGPQHVKRETVEQLVSDVSTNIIKLIHLSSKQKVYWCKILPINEFELNSYYINSIINKVNLKVLEEVSDLSNVTVIDYDNIITYDGRLDANITYDGLHPNDDGYYLMSRKLEPML